MLSLDNAVPRQRTVVIEAVCFLQSTCSLVGRVDGQSPRTSCFEESD